MKKYIMLALAAIAPLYSMASALSPAEAWRRAAGNSSQLKAKGIKTGTQPELVYTRLGADDTPALYVFAPTNDSFVIVTADDVALPVAGYADDSFDVANMPPALEYMLDFYALEISKARAAGAIWNASGDTPARAAIEPLVSSTWGQGDPYNRKCPELSGTRTLVGCVPLSMGQIMRSHRWPEKGKGTVSYKSVEPNGSASVDLSIDLSTVTFDWDNMLDDYLKEEYNDAQVEAVDNLLIATGYSAQTRYGRHESSAITRNIDRVLYGNFNYTPEINYQRREVYGSREWSDLIYGSLADGAPVIYTGVSDNKQHAFIIDGYSEDDYFHVHWGWGGINNGYYLLSALTPTSLGIVNSSAGFNMNQAALLNIRPPREGDKVNVNILQTYTLTAAVGSGDNGNYLAFEGGFENYSVANVSFTPGLRIVDTADGASHEIFLSDPVSMNYHAVKYAWGDIPLGDLKPGVYHVYPVYKTSDGEIKSVPSNINYTAYAVVTVPEKGDVTAEVPVNGELKLTDGMLTSGLYNNCDFRYEAKINSEMPDGSSIDIHPLLLDSQGKVISMGTGMNIIVNKGENDFIYTGRFQGVIPTGDYKLVFVRSMGNVGTDKIITDYISEPMDVSLTRVTPSYELVNWTLNDGVEIKDKVRQIPAGSDLVVTVTVKCNAGTFHSPLSLSIWNADGTEEIEQLDGETVFLDQGETKELTWRCKFNGEIGVGYIAGIYYFTYENAGYWAQLGSGKRFTFIDPVYVGIEEIGADNAESQTEYYNLQGVRIPKPESGICIVRKNGGTQKVKM